MIEKYILKDLFKLSLFPDERIIQYAIKLIFNTFCRKLSSKFEFEKYVFFSMKMRAISRENRQKQTEQR